MKPEGMSDAGSAFAPGKRRRMNLVAVCMNIFLPWFLFSSLYAMMSFTLHYQHPSMVHLLVITGFGAAIITGFLAYRAKARDRDPMWYTFAALSFFLAVCLAWVFGDMNFWYNMQPFYDIENLNTYPSVNPAREKGQQLMDAGRVYFADGTGLDMKKAMGFKNLDLYCVAPIVNGDNQLASYDFWAVGINCCSGNSSKTVDFKCGAFNSDTAREGLRLMSDEPRAFLRLAVQQAESAHMIKAVHPLFFYWSNDALADMHSYLEKAYRNFAIGMCGFFAAQTLLVLILSYILSKMGYNNLC